ncbi:hypothetical protein TSAR_010100 [Trichomalopsis sarcophagae]|uniref:Uncharacterized protein n=1 Tax=Trichomalopsis sarcophagae TaxID=543379 RepID=A0A232FGP3_9HYME|nr:hypothetical protein TSAR_010100 [Trichomalopsis sarcophagae]
MSCVTSLLIPDQSYESLINVFETLKALPPQRNQVKSSPDYPTISHSPSWSIESDTRPSPLVSAKRPPVEETASFLQALLASHGPNYLEKLFGSKARDALAPLGGVNKVAIALSESQTIEDFGAALHLMRSDLEHLRSVFMAVENGDLGLLKSLGIKDSELGDVKFFLEKLVDTGFLD